MKLVILSIRCLRKRDSEIERFSIFAKTGCGGTGHYSALMPNHGTGLEFYNI